MGRGSRNGGGAVPGFGKCPLWRASMRSPVASCTWIFNLLYGSSPLVTWAPAGQLPRGFGRVDQFAVLPGGRDRAFMVSLASRRGSASALTSYNALRPLRRRAGRIALGLALRSGAAAPLLGARVDIGAAADATPEQITGALITEHVATLLGRRRIVVAFGGSSGPYRKPVLQAFAADGAPIGYVKVGWNAWSRDAVRREAAALLACASAGGRLGVPALVHQGQWQGLELLVTAPLPADVRRPGRDLPAVTALREICELSPVTASELAESQWWSDIRTRLRAITASSTSAAALSRAVDRLGSQFGSARLEFGRWHGDLVPWNLAHAGPRLYAWDWESSAASAPVGFDALHFHFQLAFVAERMPLADAVARAVGAARAPLLGLAVPGELHDLLAQLHLLELAVRHEEARASSGDADDRFFPAVLRLLDHPSRVRPAASMGRQG